MIGTFEKLAQNSPFLRDFKESEPDRHSLE